MACPPTTGAFCRRNSPKPCRLNVMRSQTFAYDEYRTILESRFHKHTSTDTSILPTKIFQSSSFQHSIGAELLFDVL